MTEIVGEAISMEMLREDYSYRPDARARRAARSSSCRNGALTCCLVSIPILAGFVAYLFICQTQVSGEGCMFKIPNERELVSSPAPLYSYLQREKPRAHLTVKEQNSTHALEKNKFPALDWEDSIGLAFTKNRMNYSNTFLKVPESGDYFVYSQITFRGNRSNCTKTGDPNENKPDSIFVIVTKVSNGDPKPIQLLKGIKSVCERSSNWFQPIYLAGMFSLEEGDLLVVNVSNIAMVDYAKEEKTFFGAFLL